MKYKHLLFDLDNTLFDFNLAQDTAVRKVFKKYNVVDEEEYVKEYKIINKFLWEKLDKKEISREYLVNNRFKLVFERFGLDIDGKVIAKEYEVALGEQAQTFAGVEKVLKTLKDKGYFIYAATNGLTTIQNLRLNNSSIKKYFDDIFISEEIGVQKPDTKFFSFIQQKLNTNRDQLLMIGDTLYADIKGASDYGIDSVWANYSKKDIPDQYTPQYVIYKIEELLDILWY